MGELGNHQQCSRQGTLHTSNSSHWPAAPFQCRRYQTCVHVDDIQPLYDVSGVQAYCINSKRAVLIHPKVRLLVGTAVAAQCCQIVAAHWDSAACFHFSWGML